MGPLARTPSSVAGITSGNPAQSATTGTPKRVLSLLGVGQTDPWAWNGLAKELHGQVEKSVLLTMHGESITGGELNDIVAYLHALPPAPPVAPPGDGEDGAAIGRGRVMAGGFEARCARTSTTGGLRSLRCEGRQGLSLETPGVTSGREHCRGW